MLALSYSRINSYQTCPLQFKLAYIDKKKCPASPIMTAGSVLHKVFQAYEEHLQKNKMETDTTVIQSIAEDVFADDGSLPHEYLGEIIEAAQKYSETHGLDLKKTWNFESQVALDYTDKPCLWLDAKVAFRAVMDKFCVVGNTAFITDYKTGWKIVVDPFQLELYAYTLSRMYPELEFFEIELDFTRLNFSKKQVIEKAELGKIKNRFDKIRKKIVNTKRYTAKASSACSTCGYVGGECYERISGLEVCQTKKHAERIAKDILMLDNTIKKKKSALSEYCAGSGNVKIGDAEFGHFPTETFKGNPEKFINFMKAQGKEADEIFQFLQLSANAKRMFTGKGEFHQSTGEVYEIKEGTEFTRKSIKEDA